MSDRPIELVYFEGCPNVDRARMNLRAALESAGRDAAWQEWETGDADTPERVRRFGSPTVLVDGVDVTGKGEAAEAMACRADGAPSTDVIREALGGG